jgi:hypothetical protein
MDRLDGSTPHRHGRAVVGLHGMSRTSASGQAQAEAGPVIRVMRPMERISKPSNMTPRI